MDASRMLSLLAVVVLSHVAAAQQVRHYQQDGVTYRETTTRVRVPVSQTTQQQRTETVYREQWTTELQPIAQLRHVPVVDYRWEPRWHNVLNPFVAPHVAYHLVPQVRWQSQPQTVHVPVARREWVPRQRVVRAPVTVLGFRETDQVKRVAVAPSGSTVATGGDRTVVARLEPIGGIRRLESDPPRYGMRPAGDGTVQR